MLPFGTDEVMELIQDLRVDPEFQFSDRKIFLKLDFDLRSKLTVKKGIIERQTVTHFRMISKGESGSSMGHGHQL